MSENIVVEPDYITAKKKRVQSIKGELAAAQADLSYAVADWKGSLDAGHKIEKDVDTADLLATNARLQAALEDAQAVIERLQA